MSLAGICLRISDASSSVEDLRFTFPLFNIRWALSALSVARSE
jgi:hypothetical protein